LAAGIHHRDKTCCHVARDTRSYEPAIMVVIAVVAVAGLGAS
jgi:hypothetical protein